MADTSFHQRDDDDLPRTVRQQKEAARAKARSFAGPGFAGSASAASMPLDGASMSGDFDLPVPSAPGVYPRATVARLEIPFLHMVGFFLKAVLAAIPALLLLTLILWGFGQVAKSYMPWLVQTEIQIKFTK